MSRCAVHKTLRYGEDLEEAPMHVLWSGAHYDLLVPEGPRSKL